MIVTVLKDKLSEFKDKLPTTGCKLSGLQRRPGKNTTGEEVVDVEVFTPLFWNGSMSGAIYDLPGVRLMWYRTFRFRRLSRLIFWHLTRSGSCD